MRDAPNPRTALGWFLELQRCYPAWYVTSRRSEVDPRLWPPQFNPQRDPVFAHNELLIPVAPQRVFEILIRASDWPAYYANSASIEIQAQHGLKRRTAVPNPDHRIPNPAVLAPGTKFRWKTFGTRQNSEVTLYEQDGALGWTAESPGTHAYHRWLLTREESGTRVITEECQNGPVAWLDRHWMNPSLHAAHQLWLEKLRGAVAAGGRPQKQ